MVKATFILLFEHGFIKENLVNPAFVDLTEKII